MRHWLVCGLCALLHLQLVVLFRFRSGKKGRSTRHYSGGNISECDLATEGSINCNDDTVRSKPASVWTAFGELASKTGAYNLGQGFPDWNPPDFVLNSLVKTASTAVHQYTRPAGHPPLVELLAERYSRHLNRQIDPFNEVAVTVGASQALYLALTTFVLPGDEVILFEPFFDLYLKQLKLCAAKPVFVPLGDNSKDPWAIDIDKLRKSVTKKTKVLILNSPHNPTGKVFKLAELEAIAQIVRENPQIIVISDEVYKFSVYNPLESGDSTAQGHYHFARIKDMWDRTITLSSCGKTFSVTGWQIGWTVGPAKYILPIQELLPCVQFCAATPIQAALTSSLQMADQPYEGYSNYYEWLRSQFQSKRSILEKGLQSIGIEPIESNGGFFLMGKLPNVNGLPRISDELYDWAYCRHLATEYGVIGIPASPFFSNGDKSIRMYGPMARFAFCKKDSTLINAANLLKAKSTNRSM